MASVRQIARRIRSVESTAKITKAMSMIAASKLRKSQDAATMGRDYADNMSQMVSNVVSQISDDDSNQPLIEIRENKSACLLIVTPDIPVKFDPSPLNDVAVTVPVTLIPEEVVLSLALPS